MRDPQRINRDLGITTVVNLRFLDLAKRYGQRIIGPHALITGWECLYCRVFLGHAEVRLPLPRLRRHV